MLEDMKQIMIEFQSLHSDSNSIQQLENRKKFKNSQPSEEKLQK